MCFNKESSIIFFGFGVICSFYLVRKGILDRNKKYVKSGTLLFLISLMQLIEFFLWINQKCNKINHYLSLLIPVLLWAQPFFSYLVSIYLTKKKAPLSHKIILVLWTLFAILIIYLCSRVNMCSLSDKDTCRLVWNPFTYIYENYRPIALIAFFFYFLVFLLGYNILKNSSGILIILLIFVILASIYYKGEKWVSIFGSVYCFFCVFYGIFIIYFG